MATSYANSPFARSNKPGSIYVAVSAGATPFVNGPCRGIYIGSTGNITVTDMAGNSVQFVAPVVGKILWIQASALTAASAGSLVLIY
jgi:hypothetical protein